MRILFTVLFTYLYLAVPVRAEESSPGPPEWFREHLAYLTAGDGVWQSDNSAYTSADEPADAYEVTFVWGAGKQTAAGTMRAITKGKRSSVIWDYRVFWDPGTQNAMIQQHSFWGAYGIGETNFVDAKRLRTEQRFYAPDGAISRTAHDWVVDGPLQHTTNTFSLDDDAWKPDRSYVWKRTEKAKSDD